MKTERRAGRSQFCAQSFRFAPTARTRSIALLRSRAHRSPIPTAALLMLVATWAHSAPLSIDEFSRLASRCGHWVAPSTLASIAKTESGFEPLSIHDNTTKTAFVPDMRERAVTMTARLLQAGHSLDLGIMQIASSNLQSMGLTPEAAFDPCRSIAAAAAILTVNYIAGGTRAAPQSTLRVAISRYNTGDPQRGFDNGYVHKVELAARYIVPALDVADQTIQHNHPTISFGTPMSGTLSVPPAWDVWASFDYAEAHADASLARSAFTVEASSTAFQDADRATF